jgi:chromosome segregation ATPase
MAKDVKFNVKLVVDGKERVVELTTDMQHLSKAIEDSRTQSAKLRDSLISLNQISQAAQNAFSGIQQLTSIMQSYVSANMAQVEAETQLANNMRNTMSARDADIQSIKDLCSE